MINPTISRELSRERQTQLQREAATDRLARQSSDPSHGLDGRVLLPIADALVSFGHSIQRHYAGEPAGFALATEVRPFISTEDWLAFLARNVRPSGTFLLIHMTNRGVSGFTCWGELAAPVSLGSSSGATSIRFAPQQP